MTSESSPNTAKKLTSSFSSPEITEQQQQQIPQSGSNLDALIINKSDAENETNQKAPGDEDTGGGGGDGGGESTEAVASPRRSAHSPGISSTLIKSNTVTSPTGAFTTTSITFNSTRDSGFSDSITEDISTTTTTTTSSFNTGANGACTVSPGGLVQHILNVSNQPEDVITLHTKLNTDGGRIKLKSVEEDIDIIQPTGDAAGVQQPPASGEDQNKSFVTVVKTTKVTTKVNKKTKKNKKGSKNKEENNERDSNSDDQTAPQQKQASSSSDDNKDQLGVNVIEIPIVKVDINKSTEEYVFESTPSPVKISSSIITSTTTIAHHHHHHHHHSTASSSYQHQQDLNSTVLDSEDILSSYSPAGTPHKHLPIVLTKSTEIKIEKEEKKGPVSIPVKDQKQKQDKKEKKSLKTDNKKKEKKSTSAAAAADKSPKTTKCFQLKSSSSKRKADKLDATSSAQQTTQPSKQLKIDTTQNTTGSVAGTAPTSPAAAAAEEKHVLIDDEQKDRIIYLKPEAVELIVNELHQQDQSLNDLNGKSKKALNKMVSRSLDLLRHDRAESFDKLAERLRTEHKLDEDASYQDLRNKNDSIFGKLLKEYLVDQKLLLRLPLDKTSAQPIEEVIDFASKATGPKRRIVSSGEEDNFEDATEVPETVHEVKQDQTNVETTAESQVPVDEKIQEVKEEPKEAETEQVAPVKAEAPSEDTKKDEVKVETSIDKPDGSHIVLDTIKEPPIVFECDLHPKKEVKTDSTEPQVATAVPTEASTVVVKAATETPSKDLQKGSKTAKKQGSSLLCCGAISSRKSAESDQAKKPKVKATKEKKAEKSKKTSTTTTAVKSDDKAKVETSKPAESAVATSTQPKEAVHLDFSNLDRKPDEPLATSKEPHTIDFPTILDFEVVEPKVVVKEVKKTVVETTTEVVTKEQEAAPVETEKSDKEEGPSTPPTTPTLKKNVDLLPVGDSDLEHQLDRKSLHKALEEAAAIDEAKKSDEDQEKEAEVPDQEQTVHPDAVTAEINVVEKEETTTEEQKIDTTVVNTFNVKEEAHATVVVSKEEVDDHSKQASEESKTPAKLSDDIIKLPDPNDPARLAALQVTKQATSATGSASTQAPKTDGKKKEKKTEKSDDEGSSASCFSCRGKKADKKKKSSDVVAKKSQDKKKSSAAAAATPAQAATTSDQGNKAIKVEVTDANQKQQQPGILLTGLDPPGPVISAEQQKTLLKIKEKSVSPTRTNVTSQNIITSSSTSSGGVLPGDIAQIEIRKSIHTVSTTIIKPIVSPKGDRSSVIQIVESTTTTTSDGDQKQEETVKEYIVDLAPPQVIEEIKKAEEAEPVAEPVKEDETPVVVVKEEKPLVEEETKPQDDEEEKKSHAEEVHEEPVTKVVEEEQVEKKDDVAVEVEEKVSSPVKLSDDIIKLPDPRDRIDTIPSSKQEAKPEVAVETSKPTKSSADDKKTKKEKKKEAKPAQAKKTSPIDMPLVSVLSPGDADGTTSCGALACFGKKSKKAKKQKDKAAATEAAKKPSSAAETTPKKVPETVQVKETEPSALVVDVNAAGSESTSASPRQPLEGWSKGLDRAEGEPIVRKDLVENFVAPETKQESDQVDQEKPKEEDSSKVESTEEKQPEIPSEVVEEKKDHDKEEAEKQLTVKVDGEASKLTIDSPGAIIVIDRRPDHPVVPIVVTDRPKVTDAPVAEVTSAKPDDSKAKTDKPDQKDKKTKKEKAKSNRKTNLIDMPLLSCFNPRSTADQDDEKKPKEKKPAAKKEKKSKPVDTSAKKKPTGSDKPVPIEIEPLHISPDQPESEQQLKLVISETLNEIVTTVVQSFEQNTTTTTTEIHTKEDLPQVKPTDLNEQDIKIQLDKIEMSSSLIKQPPGLAEDRIKIDREPDIIVLPEPRTKADIIGTGQLDQPVVTITTVTTVETTTPAKKDGKEKVTKGHTSIIDMPIIDILVPKGVKKRLEKSKDPKVTETTTVTSKKTKTKTKVQVEKSKPAEKAPAQAIPTEHYVDTFFVDLIEPLPATTDVEVKKEKPKKEKKSAKVEKTETVKTVVTKKENEDLVVVITSSPSAEVIIPKPDTEEAAEKQPEAETPEQLPVVEIKSQDKEEKQPDQEVPQATKADEKSPEQVLEETRVVIKDPSDDIVKLPDPNDRAQFLAASSAAQAETAATTAASTSTSQAQASTSPGKKGKKNKKGKDHHTSPLDLPLINCMRKKDSTDSTGAEAPVVKVDKKQKAKEEREAKKRAEKEHKEQLERERKEKLEREKAEKERVERERKEQHEREKAEKERIEREKREQLELEKAEKEKADRERREREEQEKAEQRAKEEREMQLAREAEEAALKVKLEIEEARRKAEEQQVPEPVVEEKGDEKLPADEQLDESQEDQKVEYEPEDKPIKEIEGHVEHVELEPMPLVQEVQPLPAEELEAEIKKLGDEIEAIKQVEPEEPVKEIEPEEEKPVEEEHEPKAPVISEPPPNIPIVTQVIVPKTPELVEPRKTTADKSPSKDSVKRTSKIDMPLINILTPKKEKKKKSQKEAASPKKADDSIKTEVVEEVKVVIETVEDDKLPREPIVIVPPTSMPENVVVTMTTTEPTPAVAKPAQESKRDKLRREKEEKEAKRRAELEKKTRLEQEKRDLKLKKAAEAKQKKLDSEAAHKPTTTALDLPLISVVSPDISAPSTDSKKTAKQEPIEPVLEVKPVEKPVATDAEDKHKKTSPIDMPLINISGKPKQKDTKTKESSQKQKSDEPTVSCFSCKARKQKKESTQKQSPTAKQTETKTTETAKDLDKSAGGHQSPKQIKSPNEGIPLDAPYLESQHTGSEIAKIVKEIQQTEEDHLKAAAHLPEINLKPSVDVDSSLIVSQAVTVTESHVSGDEGEEKRIHPDAMEAKISLVESSVTGESTKEVGENGAEKEVHVLEKTTNKFSVKVEAHAAVLTSQKSEASYDDLNDILPQLTINSGEGETTVQSHVKLSDDTPKLTPIDKGKVAESSSVEKAQPPTKSLAKPEIAGPVAKKDDKKKKQKKEKSAHDLEDDSSKVTCFSCKGKKAASSDSSKKPGKKSADKAAKKDQPLTVVVTGGNAAGSASPAVSAGTASPRKEIDPELFKNLDQPYDESKKQASHEDQKPSISVTQKVESKTETVVTKETVDENTKDEAHHKEEHTDRVETPTHVEVTEIKNEQNLEKEKDDKVDSTQTVTKQVDVETKETVGPDSHVVEVITRTKTTEESNEEHSRITKSLEEIKTEIKTTLTSKADDPENRRGQLSDDPIVLPTRDDVKPLVPAVAVADKPVEPAVATTTHVSATTDKKGKKKDGDSSKSKLSCLICCGSKKDDKSKTKTEKKATKAPTSKPVVVEAKTQQPSVEVAIIESKPVDLKDGGELPQIVTTQEIITTTEGSSAITPPKKPPRGQLDPEVVVTVDSSNVDTSVPVDHQLNISAPVSLPEVKVEVKQKQDGQKSSVSPSTKPAKSPKQNKTSILDMPLIDILRPKHSSNGEVKRRHSSKRKSKVETSPDDHLSAESKSPEVKVKSPSKEVDVNLFRGLDSSPSSKPIVSTQQPVKPPTRLIEDQLLVTIDVKGTANELNQSDVEIFVEKTPGLPANKVGQVEVVMVRKKPPTPTPPEDEAPLVIDLPDVIDVPPTSSPRSSSNLKGTDPLPHVQLGNQKPGDSTTVKSTKTSKTIEATGIVPAVDLKAQVNGSKSDSDYVKLLTTEDKKLIKSKHKEIVAYLKQRSGYTLQQLESTSTTSTNKKELKAQEKLAEKIYERCVKVLLKKRDNKQPLTYTELSKKLEKVASPKHGGQVHIEKTVHILRSELESGSLLAHFSPRPATSHQAQTSGGKDADDSTKTKTDLTSSQDLNGNGVALRRVPSLTWRQANERARILFYKGRIPSIHYNEKRDSFRVSMITHISTQDGQDKTTEVPVNDEDVRRLLNSYGLYWDGESISLLNKSDEIFTSAEREAFAYIQLLQRQRSQQTAEEKKAEEPQTSPQPAESTPVEEPTVEQEKTDNTPQEENKSENEEDKEAVEQVVPVEESEKQQDELAEQALSEENKQE